ncbi:phytanoyl-CoA dioxygenase family protein [Chryseobacterium sp. MYb264]|uniref:phytanoyl-CoA dioxygenase family protein n=1 Tax=Chryseobacterium sp. MYb264 TaxID=2745153 RepID=UPI002E0D2E35|nr:phytanoyl-CoA dioxygenase family protein [Chryseobacterium sp. MYb264]
MPENYEESGYLHLEDFFTENELQDLEKILIPFHNVWLKNNENGFQSGLINSHSITSSEYIEENERLHIFRFISQEKIADIVAGLFPNKALFLNTQLFFDPFNKEQNNYWHRDIQYTGMSLEQQQENICRQNVIHFRIPLKPELGIELVPASHRIWDSEEELETRLSLNGRKPSDKLTTGKMRPLNRRDLLVFSANMIHRGLYGNDRFTFDIIFCDDIPDFKKFIDVRDQPTKKELEFLNKNLFLM